MKDFESIQEFNRIWAQFEKAHKREGWKMPKVSRRDEMSMAYVKSDRFLWIAETMELWDDYRNNYLINKHV